jgi:hypothetical protein
MGPSDCWGKAGEALAFCVEDNLVMAMQRSTMIRWVGTRLGASVREA